MPKISKRFARIKSRHPTHRGLRKNKNLLFSVPVVIRFGSSTKSDPGTVEINTVESVKNCANKLKMKQLFKAKGVKSPEFWTSSEIETAKVKVPIVKKIIFRSRGQGMELIENDKQLKEAIAKYKGNKNVYFEQYFNGSREYRFHVSKFGCFYTNRKMRTKEAKNRWFFNSTNCVWILETNPAYNKPKTFDAIVKECQKGLDALGLDFAAFDVRVNKEGEFAIIEANSAPSFGETTEVKYVEHLKKLIIDKVS